MNSVSLSLPYEEYRDRVLAGWIGKSLGGVIGARFENHKEFKNLTIDQLWPKELVANDDLDLQVVWLEAMQERGLFLSSRDLAEFWQDRCWYFFCEYGVFLNNFQRGIAPPLSGTWNNRFFLNSEGCPIRAEIWGYAAAGNPGLAAELALTDGQLDHGLISIQAEQFLAATAAQAVTGSKLEAVLAAGLSVLPPESPIARMLPRVQDISVQYPDHRQAWQVVVREFGSRNANDAIINHALMLLALFLGKGDFKRTMQLCVHFGWDTDCTASTVGALLGTLLGTKGLPADWVEKLGKTLICGISVKHRNALLSDFAEDTCRIGVEMASVRNPAVLFTDAPAVEIRSTPAPKVEISVDYGAEPVLWQSRVTSVTVKMTNPFGKNRTGRLLVEAPSGIKATIVSPITSLQAHGISETEMTICRSSDSDWIADKNLFRAVWLENEVAVAEQSFGLGGARQWQVYGPYWDMWDKTKSEICPYNNSEKVGGPFIVPGLVGDCYNQYVRLDAAYLDEARLVHEDLPEQIPLMIERGEDDFRAKEFGGFQGQACYYLVRTFRSPVPDLKATILLGRSGPYRAWLDGMEIGASDDIRCWSTLDNVSLNITLTGKPQRLVIKLLRLTDGFDFSLFFIKTSDQFDYIRGVSNIFDCLEDRTAQKER